MRHMRLTAIFILVLSGLFLWNSCDEDSTSEPEETPPGLEDFAEYKNWDIIDRVVDQDPFLAAAHGITDTFTRVIYSNIPDVPEAGGQFPEGKIIVKELRNRNGETVGALTSLIKRGGNFNPDGNGWEWFMTNETRDAIMTRGDNATAADGMCAGCHSAANNPANGIDWVFNHPKEIEPELEDFANYLSWTKIDENFGTDPFLAAAHGVTDSLYRIVYVNHIVTPVRSIYPTGTIIVKELRNENRELVGPLTVMAKRGGSFNPDGNGWEWFMTNETRDAIMTRGDNATAADGMCAGCHSSANTEGNGMDWVFTHPRN